VKRAFYAHSGCKGTTFYFNGNRLPTEKAQKPDEKIAHEIVETSIEIYDAVKTSGGCFGFSMQGLNCYMHVLSDLIGPGTHMTSNGDVYEVKTNIGWSWNSANHSRNTFDKITEMLKEGYCSGDVVDGQATIDGATVDNIGYEEIPGITEGSNFGTRLVGGCISDKNMTLHQRAIDLLWEVHNDYDGSSFGGDATPLNLAKFLYFVEHDLKQAIKETIYEDNPEYTHCLTQRPEMEDIPATIEEPIYKYSDADKAQWYVNLWHRMNGESDEKAEGETITTSTTSTEVSSNGVKKNTTTDTEIRNRYDILEDGLMNSKDWLKYALESGTASLERVNYTNPTIEGTGLKDATWTSIQYNNALDISEQSNETAIAKAEAEYQQKTREIENKDKQLDSMIKLLDTEHNTLQAEYESVKSVITKNTERTLKIYS
jgi:hypothetical protein